MSSVSIFWDPTGVQLDQLGSKRFLGATDGDTPSVSLSIRMLSIDTPEVHYPGTAKPSKQDGPFVQLAEWIQQGQAPIDDDLASFLHPRLASGQAGTLQLEQGIRATEAFQALLEEKLSIPGKKTKRQVFLMSANTPFDSYGRVLAYMAPNYNAEERATLSRHARATFNLLMIENGWAASFPIYPSLPRHSDLIMLQRAGKEALEARRGIWADPLTLTGYEFRMCVKLHTVTKALVEGKKVASAQRTGWIERYCCDMTTREIYYPQDYYRIAPYNRIFLWAADVSDAVARLNLVPGH